MTRNLSLTEKIPLLADSSVFPKKGTPLVRWGQILRTTPIAAKLLEDAKRGDRLVPLRDLATVHSGVVTRANAFFIVRELPFSEIPNRFRITRRDHQSVAVIVDGKNSPHRIARRHLREVVKGPESILGPTQIQESDLRLVAIEESQSKLRAERDNDTLAYLRRGETVNYSVSADKMKSGIPATRANIKNRKPFWYSLHAPEPKEGRLVIPEHFDQRFVVSELSSTTIDHVVIDTCYVGECKDPEQKRFLLLALNSLVTWYQIELRGRTQHGEGVLKVKIPDFEGILILDPSRLKPEVIDELLLLFDPVAARRTFIVNEELEQSDRIAFDAAYLKAMGISRDRLEETRLTIARELREAMAERRIRPESVAELKTQAKPQQRVSRIIDSFAARIVSKLPAYPDPRHNIQTNLCLVDVPIASFEGALTIGAGLFESGTVFAGSEPIAVTDSNEHARFLKAVLSIDPYLSSVQVPTTEIKTVIKSWEQDVAEWSKQFRAAHASIVEQLTDIKLAEAIRIRALELAHASEVA